MHWIIDCLVIVVAFVFSSCSSSFSSSSFPEKQCAHRRHIVEQLDQPHRPPGPWFGATDKHAASYQWPTNPTTRAGQDVVTGDRANEPWSIVRWEEHTTCPGPGDRCGRPGDLPHVPLHHRETREAGWFQSTRWNKQMDDDDDAVAAAASVVVLLEISLTVLMWWWLGPKVLLPTVV